MISITGVTTLPCSTGLEGFLGSSLAGGTHPGSAGTSGVGGVGVSARAPLVLAVLVSGSLGTSGVGGVGISGSLGTSGVGVGVSGSLGTSGVGGVGVVPGSLGTSGVGGVGGVVLLQSFVDLHFTLWKCIFLEVNTIVSTELITWFIFICIFFNNFSVLIESVNMWHTVGTS